MAQQRVVVVPVNEYGRRIGEAHHNARISDATVDLIRELHEDDGYGYLAICEKLNLPLTTVRKICTYERRANTPMRWLRIKVKSESARVSAPRIERVVYLFQNRPYITYRLAADNTRK